MIEKPPLESLLPTVQITSLSDHPARLSHFFIHLLRLFPSSLLFSPFRLCSARLSFFASYQYCEHFFDQHLDTNPLFIIP